MRFEREIDRSITFRNSQGASVRGTLHKLSRRTIVFEIYNPYSIVQVSEVLSELQIRRGKSVVYSGEAIVTSLVSTGIVLLVSATLFGQWTDLTAVIAGARNVREEVSQFIGDWQDANRIQTGYQVSVSELRSFLSSLSFWLDQVDTARDVGATAAEPSLSDELFAEIRRPVEGKMTDLFLKLEQAVRGVGPDEIESHKLFAQRDLLPLLMVSPFFARVFEKPLGYAGDYEMVNMMLRAERAGVSTYAQLVNDWLLQGGPPEAHRNRIRILEQLLIDAAGEAASRGQILKVLNIGCGPAQEIQRFLATSRLAERCAFDLLDFNRETLEHAAQRIDQAARKHELTPTVNYVLRSVHDLLREAVGRQPKQSSYDLVYCAGLFDYLNDRTCARLLQLFYQWTNPGGRVIATNVHAANPVRGLMEHVMEWHLILRDETQMRAIAPAEIAAGSVVYTDATGINVFLELRKPAVRHA